MNGKLTMRYTDVVIEDLRPKVLEQIHQKEMRNEPDQVDLVYPDEHLASWDCHVCDWYEWLGQRPPKHHHEYD